MLLSNLFTTAEDAQFAESDVKGRRQESAIFLLDDDHVDGARQRRRVDSIIIFAKIADEFAQVLHFCKKKTKNKIKNIRKMSTPSGSATQLGPGCRTQLPWFKKTSPRRVNNNHIHFPNPNNNKSIKIRKDICKNEWMWAGLGAELNTCVNTFIIRLRCYLLMITMFTKLLCGCTKKKWILKGRS